MFIVKLHNFTQNETVVILENNEPERPNINQLNAIVLKRAIIEETFLSEKLIARWHFVKNDNIEVFIRFVQLSPKKIVYEFQSADLSFVTPSGA